MVIKTNFNHLVCQKNDNSFIWLLTTNVSVKFTGQIRKVRKLDFLVESYLYICHKGKPIRYEINYKLQSQTLK